MNTAKLARIIGHLQFDGYVARGKNARRFFYGNSNIDLINEFVSDVEEVFNLRPFIRSENKLYRVYFYSVNVVRKLNEIVNFHSYTWFVPDFILNGDEITKILYLQAFFDDEGHASRTNRIHRNYIVIRGSSVNLNGLRSISDILLSLGIESNIKKFSKGKTSFKPDGPSYVLTITNFYNIQKFNEKIKLTSTKKQSIIDNFIRNHGKNIMRPKDEIQKVLQMKKGGYGARRISKQLGIPKGTVSHWLRGDRRCSK